MNLWPLLFRRRMEAFVRGASPWKSFLWLPSLLFGLAVKVRNRLYDRGIIKQKKSDAFVVSVGNVAAGGTGKTPFTAFLAREVASFTTVAIVSRGYKGLAEKEKEPVIVSYGKEPVVTASVAGDEPYLLARHLPGVIVVAGKDRFKGAQIAAGLGAKVVILDDGMQHRRLKRDIEIALCGDNEKNFLPYGLLRDEPRRLKKAHWVLSREHWEEKLTTQVALKGQKVAVFCAIARPERFLESVKQLGAESVMQLVHGDHEVFTYKQLQQFALRAKKRGANFLVCTEKDEVKVPQGKEFALPLAWVRKEVVACKQRHLLDEMIETIKRGCSQ